MTTEVTEAQPEEPVGDPDVEAALQEESEILTRELEQMKAQHFQQRLIAMNVENRQLKRRIAELEDAAASKRPVQSKTKRTS